MRTIAVIANTKLANLFKFFGIDLSFSIPEDGEIKEICEKLIAKNVGIIFTTEELESKVKEIIKDYDNVSTRDASMKEFGYGATEVVIRK